MRKTMMAIAVASLMVMGSGCKKTETSGSADASSEQADSISVDNIEGTAAEAAEAGETAEVTEVKNENMENEKVSANKEDVIVKISTTKGEITVRLYGDTPRHRDNFVKLAKEGFYEGTLFHRVINEFMVQAGDPDSKGAAKGKMLGSGDPGYTLAAEINYPKHFHKRGALAAARTGDQVNPERRSSGSQFYIVTGKKYGEKEVAQLEQQLGMGQQQTIFQRLVGENRAKIQELQSRGDRDGLMKLQEELIAQTEAEAAKNPVKLTEEQRKAYTTVGGTPHLDGQYTVFGEVVSGMEVVAAIEKVATDRNDRPTDDVKIVKVEVVE